MNRIRRLIVSVVLSGALLLALGALVQPKASAQQPSAETSLRKASNKLAR